MRWFKLNPCGELYPSTIKSGLPTPSITKLTRECIGYIEVTTFISALDAEK